MKKKKKSNDAPDYKVCQYRRCINVSFWKDSKVQTRYLDSVITLDHGFNIYFKIFFLCPRSYIWVLLLEIWVLLSFLGKCWEPCTKDDFCAVLFHCFCIRICSLPLIIGYFCVWAASRSAQKHFWLLRKNLLDWG